MNKISFAAFICSLISTTIYAAPNTKLSGPPIPKINCEYLIPKTTQKIPLETINNWATNAAIQSFDFNYNQLDGQLSALQLCYTEQGWQGFFNALQQSGNIVAIKSQKLITTSQVNGIPRTITKDKQWKTTVPLRVVYQNEKERFTQALTVNLTITRQKSGRLGIMQLIAIPKTNIR